MKRSVSIVVVLIVALGLAACTPEPPISPPSASPPASSEPSAGPAIVLEEPDAAGSTRVVIDPAALEPAFYSFVESNPSDPYYHFHTEQSDLFLGVELYTQYGPGWTGQLGTFPVDCTTHGICVYLDVDGTGPIPGVGPAGAGEITIAKLEGGHDLTLTGVTFGEYILGDIQLVG